MKIIGINSLFLIPGKVGGTEIFFRKQVEELSKIKTKNKYIIYANTENKDTFKNLSKNFRIINTRVKASNRLQRILWEQCVLPFYLLKDKVNLLHSPGYTTPLITHCKKITTIFDLNYHFHPKTFSWAERLVYSVLIPLGAYTSNKVIVHSYEAKKEMKNILGVGKNKIEVIYGGVPDEFKKEIPYSKALKMVKGFKISPPFILANATIHPHKNLGALVTAFIELSKNKKFIHKLVLLGVYGRSYSEIDKQVKENNLSDRVVFTGWIDHKDTMYFNKIADIFVMPSLYEGFGLPVAEAMACGTPLISSKYSCVPEITGNGGLIIDVKKPKLIAKTIKYLLGNKNAREKLSRLGKERAKVFSWKEMGQKIYNLYNA